MSFPNIKITKKGRELIARSLTGEAIQFTRFAIGSGECGNVEDWEGLTELIHHEMDVDITNFTRNEDIVDLQGEFSNSTVAQSFWWRELSIYATLPGVDGYDNVMCFYGNAEDLAEFVPSASVSVSVTHRWDTTLMISGTADVSAIVHSITYVTTDQFNGHLQDTNNPHKVTALQVGLGNVPNVSTNDQTVTYTVADALMELTSGEKLSVAFGKIATAIKNLISHINDKNNPHNVGCETIGAAEKNHRSTGTSYGMANDTYFGHAKITDDTTKSNGASDGIAASPKFVQGLIESHGHNDATQTASGYMSAADKKKLDGIADGANKTIVDSDMSATSTNPVQNKVVNDALEGKAPISHTHDYAGSSSAGGPATSASKLETARSIDGVSFDGSADIIHYGVCSTSGSTAAKVVDCANFKLVTGARVVVKFENTNTISDPKLNVNGTGAKSIYYNGSAIDKYRLRANQLVMFVYDGTNYEVAGQLHYGDLLSEGTAITSDFTLSSITSGKTPGVWYVPSAVDITGNMGLPTTEKGKIIFECVGDASSTTKRYLLRYITLSGAEYYIKYNISSSAINSVGNWFKKPDATEVTS